MDENDSNDLWVDAKKCKMSRWHCRYYQTVKRFPLDEFVKYHMLFDIKIEDFLQMTMLVSGSHMSDPPATITYASVVSREMIYIVLTTTTLNDIENKTSDILNMFLLLPTPFCPNREDDSILLMRPICFSIHVTHSDGSKLLNLATS